MPTATLKVGYYTLLFNKALDLPWSRYLFGLDLGERLHRDAHDLPA
jgi:hypothetical protein